MDVVGEGQQIRRSVKQQPIVDPGKVAPIWALQEGELSSVRQALEGAFVAPGNEESRTQLIDPSRRPPVPRTPRSSNTIQKTKWFLDGEMLLENLRNSRRGAIWIRSVRLRTCSRPCWVPR